MTQLYEKFIQMCANVRVHEPHVSQIFIVVELLYIVLALLACAFGLACFCQKRLRLCTLWRQ